MMKFIVGGQSDGTVVFCTLDYRNGKYFANFESAILISWEDFDLDEYYEDYVDEMKADGNWLWSICNYYRCVPYELATHLADDITDPIDFLNCSIYPYAIPIDGEDGYIKDYFLQDIGFGRPFYALEDFIDIPNIQDSAFAINRLCGKTAYNDTLTPEDVATLENACDRMSNKQVAEWLKNFATKYDREEL